MDEILRLLAQIDRVIEANPTLKARMEQLDREADLAYEKEQAAHLRHDDPETATWTEQEEASYRMRHMS